MIACYSGPDLSEGQRLLKPLREFGTPVLDAFQEMPFPAMQSMLDGGFPDGNYNYWKSTFAPAVQIPEPASDGSAGVIFELRQSDGSDVLGIRLRPVTNEAHVGLAVPSECVQHSESGKQELRDEGACSQLPVRGEVDGNGTTAAGVQFVILRVNLYERCNETLSIGDTWPFSGRGRQS